MLNLIPNSTHLQHGLTPSPPPPGAAVQANVLPLIPLRPATAADLETMGREHPNVQACGPGAAGAEYDGNADTPCHNCQGASLHASRMHPRLSSLTPLPSRVARPQGQLRGSCLKSDVAIEAHWFLTQGFLMARRRLYLVLGEFGEVAVRGRV